jgi:WD40-like Beta Propeller Repeat
MRVTLEHLIRAAVLCVCLASAAKDVRGQVGMMYLNQAPPSDTAKIFAPGIVNTGLFTRDLAIMPDGSEIYFGAGVGDYEKGAIWVTRLIGDEWTKPAKAPFATDDRWKFIEPAISPDGQSLFFVSDMPAPGESGKRPPSIWKMERRGEGWGAPALLPAAINNGKPTYFPSVTNDGSLYFTRRLDSGREVIVRSQLVDGIFEPVEVLPDEVNGGKGHYNAYVSPDESFIIVPTEGRSDSMGRTDYFVSFRNARGEWRGPFNLGPTVNTRFGDEWSPYVSPDGKYLFFMRGTRNAVATLRALVDPGNEALVTDSDVNRLGLIYWIDASVIHDHPEAGK